MGGAVRSKLITLYSDIQESSVRWLWYPFIAFGKVTLIQGDPGDGKSTMVMNLIAELSKGGTMPDGRAIGRPKRVIYQCSEDGASDTIKPRLIQYGADCNNVAFIDEEVYEGITLDDERIHQAIATFMPSMVVIDPVQAYISSNSDLQVAARARKLIRKLAIWAEMFECAIVLIGHMNKHEGAKGIYRSIGSVDLVASARSVLQIERDTKDPEIRIVKQIKNSLGPSNMQIRFEIRKDTGFCWIDTELNLKENKEQAISKISFTTKSEKAAYLIKTHLKSGKIASNEMYQILQREGISHSTAEKTKKEMGIVCKKDMNCWYWSLP